jgi:hypothetical protein
MRMFLGIDNICGKEYHLILSNKVSRWEIQLLKKERKRKTEEKNIKRKHLGLDKLLKA